ncbi:MAG: hypothetical protein RR500_00860 [Bacilli bacterium]
MKLLKKGTIACATLSILLLGGCASKVDEKAIRAFGESGLEFTSIKSAAYTLNIDAKMNNNSGKITLEGAFDARKDLAMDMNATIEQKDIKNPNTMDLIIKDSVLYMQMMGNKQAISFASLKPMLAKGQETVSSKTQISDKDIENMKKLMSKASLKDDKLALEFDIKALQEQLDKQSNKALAGVNIEKLTIDATINKNKMTSGKLSIKINNKDTKEVVDITINFDLKNINEDVKLKEVQVKDYGVAIDGMEIFKAMVPSLMMK